MKIFFTISFLFLLLSIIAFAQPKIGLKAGLNIANVGGDDADQIIEGQTLDSKTGFCAGAFFMYQFSPLFSVQPEVYYTMKGATYKEGGAEYTLTLNYFEVPILLKIVIPVQGSNINPAIFAGPFIAFNSTAKQKIEFNGQTQEEDIEDVKSTEFGAQFGGGISFGVGNNEVGVDIRYILGLTTADDSSDPYDIKNNVLNFNAYFAFSLL